MVIACRIHIGKDGAAAQRLDQRDVVLEARQRGILLGHRGTAAGFLRIQPCFERYGSHAIAHLRKLIGAGRLHVRLLLKLLSEGAITRPELRTASGLDYDAFERAHALLTRKKFITTDKDMPVPRPLLITLAGRNFYQDAKDL